MKKWPIVALLLPLFLPACGEKKPAPPASPTSSGAEQKLPPGFEKLTPEGKARWLADEPLRHEREAQNARDRAELVRPAAAGFKPEVPGRRIRLTLIPQKTIIRKGERLWYRLELQNVGSEPIRWTEANSLFKAGGLWSKKFSFYITPPGGKEREALGEIRVSESAAEDIVFPPGTDEAGKAQWFKKLVAWSKRPKGLNIPLQPGETLVSRSWSQAIQNDATNLIFKGIDPDTATPGQYRELPTEFQFDKPGTYRIRVAYDDRPSPLTEPYLQEMEKFGLHREDQIKHHERRVKESLGPLESGLVSIEVVP